MTPSRPAGGLPPDTDRLTLTVTVVDLATVRKIVQAGLPATAVPAAKAPDVVKIRVEAVTGPIDLPGLTSPPPVHGTTPLELSLPAALHPRDEAGAWDIDLYGGALGRMTVATPWDPALGPWADVRDRLRARNRALGLVALPSVPTIPIGPASMPSALATLTTTAFHPIKVPVGDRVAALRGRHRIDDIPVGGGGLIPKTTRRITVDLQPDPDRPLQMHLPIDRAAGPVEGAPEDLAHLCLQRMAQLDTFVLADLMALIDLAVSAHTPVLALGVPADEALDHAAQPVPWAVLGRRRGWPSLRVHRRYHRLKESVDLLSTIAFTIDLQDARGTRINNVPLFSRLGDVVERHGKPIGSVLSFNPLLWRAMTDDRRAILYDRAILAADLRHQEWHFRIYRFLTTRWSMSWQAQALYATEGRQRHRLGTVLEGAGVEYRDQLARKGPAWLRGRVREVLTEMAAATWDGKVLIRQWTLEEDPQDPLQDALTVWPPDAIVAGLNALRSKAIAARVEATEAPALPVGRGRPRRGTRGAKGLRSGRKGST